MTSLAPIALWRPPGELCQKLIEMQADTLDRMARRGAVEPGHLPLIAGIDAALTALDRSAQTEAAAPAAVDGSGTAELAPTAAIALAGALLDAAGVRLADDLAELRRKDSR